MAGSIELSALSGCSVDDPNVYEAVRGSRIDENEYVEIKNVSERATLKADQMYANTILQGSSTESHDSDGSRTRSVSHIGQSDAAEDIASIHRTLGETLTSLKRVQITCIVLAIALVACSATLGALILTTVG